MAAFFFVSSVSSALISLYPFDHRYALSVFSKESLGAGNQKPRQWRGFC